jgi:Tfp pilus assembly protein PilN
MGLHLNLYHEIERAKLARQRDPLKLSLFAIAGIAALLALYYVWELGGSSRVGKELNAKQAEYNRLDPQAKVAQQREAELNTTIKTADALIRRIEDRFYWAPLMEQIIRIVPAEVQITRMNGELQTTEARRCNLSLEGVAAGSDPRQVAENLRQSLADSLSKQYTAVTATFRALEDGSEMVKFNGQDLPTASFTIAIQITPGPPPADTAAATVSRTP